MLEKRNLNNGRRSPSNTSIRKSARTAVCSLSTRASKWESCTPSILIALVTPSCAGRSSRSLLEAKSSPGCRDISAASAPKLMCRSSTGRCLNRCCKMAEETGTTRRPSPLGSRWFSVNDLSRGSRRCLAGDEKLVFHHPAVAAPAPPCARGTWASCPSRYRDVPPFLLDASLRQTPTGLTRKSAPGGFFKHVKCLKNEAKQKPCCAGCTNAASAGRRRSGRFLLCVLKKTMDGLFQQPTRTRLLLNSAYRIFI